MITIIESLGNDYSNLPMVEIHFVNNCHNGLPGIVNLSKLIQEFEDTGYDTFKVRTTHFGKNICYADIKDEFNIATYKRLGWSVGKDWDTSLSGFNEVYIVTRMK